MQHQRKDNATNLSPQTRQFIREMADADVNQLLLSASKYAGVDIPFAVEQILSRRQIREKLPTWYANEELLFPARLAAEQASSESTARYKQSLIESNDVVADLTGGLGIDSFFLSQKAKRLTYCERYEAYCVIARHNFSRLGADNITVRQGDSLLLASELSDITLYYIDPARRGDADKRLYALQDCEPDLTRLLPTLWKQATKVIAKLSPMIDITQTRLLLPQTTSIHVLSVRNECKELLFVMEREQSTPNPLIHCVDIDAEGESHAFCFTPEEERNAPLVAADTIGNYLYEPNASIMKGGAFKQIAHPFGLKKLAVNSHLYTSDQQRTDFPGRLFEVEELIPFHSNLMKKLAKRIPQANITVRNFPLTVQELRKRTKIADGGAVYLFATTLGDDQKVLVRCRRVATKGEIGKLGESPKQ